MSNEERFRKLQRLAESQKDKKSQLKGQRSLLIDKLRSKGIKTPKQSETKIASLDSEIKAKERQFKTLATKFENEHARELQRDSKHTKN